MKNMGCNLLNKPSVYITAADFSCVNYRFCHYIGCALRSVYDEETVDEVTRYMLAVATDDAARPLVFVTFDRITSDDALFRKSALIRRGNVHSDIWRRMLCCWCCSRNSGNL